MGPADSVFSLRYLSFFYYSEFFFKSQRADTEDCHSRTLVDAAWMIRNHFSIPWMEGKSLLNPVYLFQLEIESSRAGSDSRWMYDPFTVLLVQESADGPAE